MSILTAKLEEKARKDLNETPENVEKGLKNLKHLIVSQTSLHFPKDDPDFLVRFLRWSHWDPEKAFDRLKKYYEARISYRKDYEGAKPSKLMEFYDEHIQCLLPKVDKYGCRIIYTKLRNLNPDKIDANLMFRSFLSILEKLSNSVDSQINGVTFLSDCNGISGKQAVAVSAILYKFVDMVFMTLPITIKEIHIVTDQPIFLPVAKLFNIALPESFKGWSHIYCNQESLHEKMDKDLLPPELGGNLPSLDYCAFAKEMLDWEPTWNKILKYPAN